MHYLGVKLPNGHEAHVNHNGDWSGEAHVTWTDECQTREATIPCAVLLRVGHSAAHSAICSRLISTLEGMSPDFGTSKEPPPTSEQKTIPPKASPRTECSKCGQFYAYGTSMIGPCVGSSYDDKRAGWRDPAHAWATVVDPPADAATSAAGMGPERTAEHVEASLALVALGQADDGRPLAERIGDAHAEVMRHLHAARADIAQLTREKAALEAERNAEKNARSTLRGRSLAVCEDAAPGDMPGEWVVRRELLDELRAEAES